MQRYRLAKRPLRAQLTSGGAANSSPAHCDSSRWLALAPAFWEEANRRLRANGLPIAKYQKNPAKPVPVHASLGKELCVLCWAVEDAPPDDIPNALRNWDALAPEERARVGVFLAFQYPIEIPGVNNVYLLKAALNAKRRHQGQPEVDAFEFLQLVRAKTQRMQMDEAFLSRGVNEGFSGGEKKRNEVLQMQVLEPVLALLDETDSGLDIDALKVVAQGVNDLRAADRAIVMVTHYQRLLDYIVPDLLHVLADGRILKTGGKELALELERRGYDWVRAEASAA